MKHGAVLTEIQPKKRPRVGKNVIDLLGSDICKGVFPAGSLIPSENNLCERYGASRTVIRETMNVMESKGLVLRKARVGTSVTLQDEWNILDAQVLKWLGDRIRNSNILDSVLEARRLIEPIAAEKAAERAELSEILSLETAWREMTAAHDDRERFIQADIVFHQVLLKASHNRVFQQLGHSFQAAIHCALEASGLAAETLDDAIKTHGTLVEALRLRDGNLARVTMEEMLDLSARDLAIAAERSDDQYKQGPN